MERRQKSIEGSRCDDFPETSRAEMDPFPTEERYMQRTYNKSGGGATEETMSLAVAM